MKKKPAKDYFFEGFSKMTFNFLLNLESNNNKSWFEKNKNEYNEYLLKPMQNLVKDLSEYMLNIDPNFEVTPFVNKTISRIYRDVRFSRDKTPFRSNMWITFKRSIKDWKDTPVYFFEVFPEFYRYGMGFYSASKATMDKFRNRIDKKPDEFKKVISFYQKQKIFVLEGEKYKRVLNKNNSDDINNWYQRKSFYLSSNNKINDAIFKNDLINDLMNGFKLLKPLYDYLWMIKN